MCLMDNGIYLSQLVCVCRIWTNDKDFEIAMQKITLEFVNKSFHKANLLNIYMRFIEKYAWLMVIKDLFYLITPMTIFLGSKCNK